MLLWAIANGRHDIVTLALARGADPNSPSRPNPYIPTNRASLRIGTPVDIAISMRRHSANAESHALKLGTVALLLAAGGVYTTDILTMCARYGDLDLLALCLGYLAPIGESGPGTLLTMVARNGHVEATGMVIAAGAPVNSVGTYPAGGYYPPLSVCWDSPLAVLEVLLDAGADPSWRDHDNISIVQNMRNRSLPGPELDDKVALLIRYGAVDEPPLWQAFHQWTPGGRRKPTEYHGWTPDPVSPTDVLGSGWVIAGLYGGCECLTCPLYVTGGVYSNRQYEARGGSTFDVWSAEAVERKNVEDTEAADRRNIRR